MMPTFVTMKKQYEGEGEPRKVRVVKSAFERVWSNLGWTLVGDGAENVMGEPEDTELDAGLSGEIPQAPSLVPPGLDL
jgi:hypothetical protein